ncbi:Sec-independent protein translocase protein TatA [mine drainage metagenome]|uniref:Sec-independent protein translocase protein TatA n=1 Tax=mine drainage metagenome TaxID=410659 RepID=A0A1J5QUV5_9ZZZZ
MFRNGLTPAHVIVVLILVVLLFGARRLPDVAKSVGQSLRIFKSEIKDLGAADTAAPSAPPPASPAPAAPTTPSTSPSDPTARPPSSPSAATDTDPLPPAGAGPQV